MNPWPGTLVLILAGLALAFLLSGMEAGVFALSRLKIRQQARAGNDAARVLHGLLENPEAFLWTILVGNTLSLFLVVSLTAYRLHVWLGDRPWLALPALAVAIFLLHALVDLLPKMLFRQFPNRLCVWMARPFRLIHLLLSPFVAGVARLANLLLRITGGQRFTGQLFRSRDELRRLMQESAQSLSREEQSMVNRVLELQNVRVSTIALPLRKVVTTTTDTTILDVFQRCRETGFSRLPVREADTGRIVGIVSLRNSLYRSDLDPAQKAGAFLQPALYLEESLRLETALQRLRESGQRLAIVLDRNQREVGILALHDILRFLFGEVSH